MSFAISRHAKERIRQRGYRERDLGLIVEHGTSTGDGFALTARDVAHRVGELKREINLLLRLKGSFVAVAGGTVMSVYRPDRRRRRRLLADSPKKGSFVSKSDSSRLCQAAV